ncbi:MAG: NlpC/P60 family protein [Eubacteriales bacterium]|nr:NlpC/P60 family protein [Eubacteriales bacterium]
MRQEEQAAHKTHKDKQEKKKERAEAKAEQSAVKLDAAKEKLARQKPQKPPGLPKRAAKAAGAGVWAYGHQKIHEVEQENVGTEGAHKTELLAEAGARKVSRYAKRRIREHPARQVEKWEHKTMKANANLHYQQMAQEHPELSSNVLSRMAQKWKIKREYARQAREAAKQTAKAAGTAATTTEKAAAHVAQFVRNHKGGALIILLLFVLFLILNSAFSALPSLGTGMMNAVVGTSYTAEDEDILGANEDYTALEDELRREVANIESTHPGYDEYRYDVDELGHNPYELTSYLIAKLRTYTRENVQGELRALFEAQYKLTLTEEVEIRYRTETDTWTDEEGNTHTDTYEVPYEYYILHVRLDNKTLPVVVNSLLSAEQKEIYDITLELKGNKPYLWDDIYSGGGGSHDPGSDYTIPGEALSDPAFAALITEAEKYLGYPYVWGGSSPSTSFDCSGFVCWVYSNSGVHSLPRTTANGILSQCARVSPQDAKPGDLIFFQGTYNTSGASHVGIYVGNNMMIHCGAPIKYASIATSYWQQHFYTFGRLD